MRKARGLSTHPLVLALGGALRGRRMDTRECWPRFDGEDAALAIDGGSVAKSEVHEAVAGQGEIGLVGLAFEFREHARGS